MYFYDFSVLPKDVQSEFLSCIVYLSFASLTWKTENALIFLKV